MNRRLLAPAAAVLALGGFLAACGDDPLSRDEVIEKLQEDAGFSQEQATCIADTLGDDAESRIDDAAEDPESEEAMALAGEIAPCLAGGISIPEVSLPDMAGISIPEISLPDMAGITIPEPETS